MYNPPAAVETRPRRPRGRRRRPRAEEEPLDSDSARERERSSPSPAPPPPRQAQSRQRSGAEHRPHEKRRAQRSHSHVLLRDSVFDALSREHGAQLGSEQINDEGDEESRASAPPVSPSSPPRTAESVDPLPLIAPSAPLLESRPYRAVPVFGRRRKWRKDPRETRLSTLHAYPSTQGRLEDDLIESEAGDDEDEDVHRRRSPTAMERFSEESDEDVGAVEAAFSADVQRRVEALKRICNYRASSAEHIRATQRAQRQRAQRGVEAILAEEWLSARDCVDDVEEQSVPLIRYRERALATDVVEHSEDDDAAEGDAVAASQPAHVLARARYGEYDLALSSLFKLPLILCSSEVRHGVEAEASGRRAGHH